MKRFYDFSIRWSWDLLVFFLPITSLPLLSRLMGGTDVAPLSVVFLAILVLVWFLPWILRGRGLPSQSIPLTVFVLAALISSLLAFFNLVPSFTNEGLWKNLLSNLITLGIGFCFFILTSLWISTEAKLIRFIRIVNLSGTLALLYALIQAMFIIVLKIKPSFLVQFQNLISSSHTLFVGRINGLAFEPSWLAHQLNMLFIPIWLGLSIKKVSCYKFRLLNLSIENLLLVAALIVLFLTKSRIGWLAFLSSGAYLFLRFMDEVRNRITTRIAGSRRSSKAGRSLKILFNIGFWFLLILVLQGVFILAGWVLSRIDPRMVQLFDVQAIQNLGVLGWASRLVFAERIVYWIAGFQVFLLHPIFGVGLGNSGYYLSQTMNSFGFQLTEILRIFLSGNLLPNSKNLWVRILAETGIMGFSIFIGWLWSIWKTTRANENNPSSLAQAMGWMGQVAIIGLIFEGFSIDTFALPYYWITLGLVVATYRIFSMKSTHEVRSVSIP